jgi:excinuclease ABC subunit B
LFNIGNRQGESGAVRDAYIRQVDGNTIEGYVITEPEYVKKYQAGASVAMYFYAKLDRAPESVEVFYQDSALMARNEIKGPGAIMCLNYKTKKDEIVNVKIGLSYTSIENAKVNLESEAKDLAFDEAMKATTDKWNESLSRILVSGGTEDSKIKFYTGLYHALLGRGLASDVNGAYPKNDGTIGQIPLTKDGKPEYNHYNTDAVWGAYWNLTSLWALAYPEYYNDFVNSQLLVYKDAGWLGDGIATSKYVSGVGTNMVSITLAGAYNSGIRNFDVETAYQAALKNELGWEGRIEGAGKMDVKQFVERGYVPYENSVHFGTHPEGSSFSVSHTLEYSFSAYAVAQWAKALGRMEDYKRLMELSAGWEKLFDDSLKMIRPRVPNGEFIDNFNPLESWRGFQEGNQCETLLGVTGSGKTFTMANVIQKLNKPTLIIAHNKTLAAQLYGEFKEFFPENAVEYFVSYYDYYQPEAYVPSSDTYIAKDSARNDEIDKLRLSATSALSERNDVIVVSSVSCIYGIGSPKDYMEMIISLRPGMEKDRDDVIRQLIDIQYDRNDMDFHRGTFRVRGDVLEIFPAEETDKAVRVEFFGDEIDRLVQIDTLTGEILCELNHIAIFPASHYVVPMDTILKATGEIEKDMEEQVKFFKHEGKLIEAQRIEERTNFDIEMLKETGICSGIENYSRYLSGLKPGEPPYTLMDYFGDDFLIIVDESHKTVPQIRSMYAGDQSRKSTLVDYGFRLPSAKDNRPLNFGEFEDRIDQILFVSATPGDYEADHELLRAEQIIRPTGLLDPDVEVRPVEGQIDDLISEVKKETEKHNKVLVTTLTKRMAEDLTDYMKEAGIRVRYLHSDIDTLERTEIIRDMRLDVFDVLVGINLLREGLDIPEITLVAILDADKEGFLRSETSLIQTIGRAARNSEGHVIMYADVMTDSMRLAIDETKRRRALQEAYNKEHGITPTTIKKAVRDLISISKEVAKTEEKMEKDPESMSREELEKLIGQVQKQMKAAAAELNFEMAAELRDKMITLKKSLDDMEE